jgi:hypothetical protein
MQTKMVDQEVILTNGVLFSLPILIDAQSPFQKPEPSMDRPLDGITID